MSLGHLTWLSAVSLPSTRCPPQYALHARSANVGSSGGYPVYEDRDTFYTALSEFIQDGENARFQSDLVFKDDETIEVRQARGRGRVASGMSHEGGISPLLE